MVHSEGPVRDLNTTYNNVPWSHSQRAQPLIAVRVFGVREASLLLHVRLR